MRKKTKERIFACMMAGMLAMESILPVGNGFFNLGVEEAHAETMGDWVYRVLDDGTVSVSGYKGSETEVVIPDNIDGKSVTKIGDYAFEECNDLTSIEIPEGVTEIGEDAFYGCSGLVSIEIPDSVTEIGYMAFSECYNLESIVIPSGLTEIEDEVFYNCSSLKNVEIPSDVTRIGVYSFYGCSSLESIEIPNAVMEIDSDAFSGCSSLESIVVAEENTVYDSRENCNAIIKTSENKLMLGCENTKIPNSVIEIAWGAFSDCSGLKNIRIPDSVTKIGERAFYGCSNLESIVVAEENTIYDSRENCNAIIETSQDKLIIGCKNTKIPNSVIEIGSKAFDGCSGLTNIEIPNSVTSIKDSAFRHCSGLISIKIPGSVSWIENSTFQGCNSLSSVEIPDNVTMICADAFAGCSALTNVDIPNSVTEIGGMAFRNCSGLTSIKIPSSVTRIDHQTFDGCSALTSIEIPDSVTEIADTAFYGCNNLASIKIAEENIVYDSRENCNAIIETTENRLMLGCKNTKIPDGVTKIGYGAFEGCSGLTSIEIPNSVTEIAPGAFSKCDNLVIYSSINSYAHTYAINNGIKWEKSLSDKNSEWDYEELEDGTVSILGYCGTDTKVTIPDKIDGKSVTCIGDKAFYGCSSLTAIEIPDNITKIGKFAFADCNTLESIAIPSCVTEIGNYAFWNCSGLASIEIPDSVTKIGAAAFNGCSGLTSIVIPDGVTGIEEGTFGGGCCSLQHIEIPCSVTYIAGYAFSGCSALTSIEIPSSVTYIGNEVFSGCSALTSIEIPSSVTEIHGAFDGCSSLESIVVADENTVYDSRENCNAIIETSENRLIVGCKNTKIPDGVLKVGWRAFAECNNLKSIVIPDSVTEIEDVAFATCNSLECIEIPNSVTKIGTRTFIECNNIVIYSKKNSYAHTYAIGNNITWKDIDSKEILLQDQSVSLETTTYTYDGKAKEPAVTVKVGDKILVVDKDYTVTYTNNIKVGTATVIVTGKGDYTGTVTKTFIIKEAEKPTQKPIQKPSAVKSLKQKTSYTTSSATLTWGKVSGATGYEVYRATSKNGKYTKVATVSKTSYKNSKLKAGKTYYYKVRAYKTVNKTNIYGDYSSVITAITKTSAPSVTVKAGKKKATVTWKKVTGADGYEVYMSTSKSGTYKKLKTVNKKTTSYTKSKLTKGKKYYFKVRTYRTVLGKKVYSSWSAVKNVKVK